MLSVRVILAIWGTSAAAAGAELTVTLREADQPVAAAVRLHDAAGNLFGPESALDLSSLGFHYTASDLIHYADWKSTRVRSQDPHFGSAFFRAAHPPGTGCFFVTGGFRVEVPPGRYTLVVTRGLEYRPVERTLEISGAQSVAIALERWVDMAERGWYSGDAHVHAARPSPAADATILAWAAAEDVRVVNVLRMGDARETFYEQYGYGAAGTVTRDGRGLIPGQEDPRTAGLGHTLHLGLAAPERDGPAYYDYRPVFTRARAGGALSGFAHVGRRRWFFAADRGLTLAAPAGQADFAEIAEMGYIGVGLWHEFLNLGFRLTAMAGSDVPWGGTIGGTRVYAQLEGPFTPARWLEAVRRGRTFVTTGPMLEFTVNGQGPGSILALPPGASVRVRARAWGGTAATRPAKLKLVAFGRTVQETTGEFLEWETTAERSLWLSAQAETNRQPLMDAPGYFAGAVSTPVYLEVAGEPSRDRERLPELLAARLQSLDAIESWLDAPPPPAGGPGGRESGAARDASARQIRTEVARARAWYRDLARSQP